MEQVHAPAARRRRVSPARRGAIFALSVVTVVVVGVAGARAISAPEPARWPGKVALIGVDGSDPRRPARYLALVDPLGRAVVELHPDTVVEIPGAGFLRAYHAWRLGGESLVRSMFERLLGVNVPFAVTGAGSDMIAAIRSVEVSGVPSEDTQALLDALRDATSWRVHAIEGTKRPARRGSLIVPDPASVDSAARAVGGLGTRVFVDPDAGVVTNAPGAAASPVPRGPVPSPSARPTVAAGDVSVDVLNAGEVDLAATKTASKLRTKGFKLKRIADLLPQDRERSFVYHAPGSEEKAKLVAAELGYPVEERPGDIASDADVVVVLGHDAKV